MKGKSVYEMKERCLYCDVIKQEMIQQERSVDCDDLFAAFCPFASRVPYETWIMPTQHHCSFEEDLNSWEKQLHFARFFKGILQRLEAIAPAHQLVLHTSPNVTAKFDRTGHWQTLGDDYHWHMEILPVLRATSKSYSIKEVYYNSLPPEAAAKDLRNVSLVQKLLGVQHLFGNGVRWGNLAKSTAANLFDPDIA